MDFSRAFPQLYLRYEFLAILYLKEQIFVFIDDINFDHAIKIFSFYSIPALLNSLNLTFGPETWEKGTWLQVLGLLPSFLFTLYLSLCLSLSLSLFFSLFGGFGDSISPPGSL
jgi:hypothetical protein